MSWWTVSRAGVLHHLQQAQQYAYIAYYGALMRNSTAQIFVEWFIGMRRIGKMRDTCVERNHGGQKDFAPSP